MAEQGTPKLRHRRHRNPDGSTFILVLDEEETYVIGELPTIVPSILKGEERISELEAERRKIETELELYVPVGGLPSYVRMAVQEAKRLRELLSTHRLALQALIPIIERGQISELVPALQECLAAILEPPEGEEEE